MASDLFKVMENEILDAIDKQLRLDMDKLFGTTSNIFSSSTLTATQIKESMEEARRIMSGGRVKPGSERTVYQTVDASGYERRRPFNEFTHMPGDPLYYRHRNGERAPFTPPENPLAKGAITIRPEDVRDATNDITRKDRMLKDGKNE